MIHSLPKNSIIVGHSTFCYGSLAFFSSFAPQAYLKPPSISNYYSNKFDAKEKKWLEKEEPKIVLKQCSSIRDGCCIEDLHWDQQ